MHTYSFLTAGRPALHGSEPGQVRKEAATAILCKCRGFGSPPFFMNSVWTALNEDKMKKIKMLGRCLLAGFFTGVCLSLPVGAVDGISFEFGKGDGDANGVDMGRVGLQWDWSKQWLKSDNWHLGGYWDLSLGYWRHNGVLPGQNDNITEIGLTPVMRYQQNDLKGLYFEAAVGAHLLSKTSLGSQRFSTALQFGSHLGAGYRFGDKGAFDLSYRYQHLSNARIKSPNDGINFNQVRLQYHF
jgi:lipid A 3-O-deacylase